MVVDPAKRVDLPKKSACQCGRYREHPCACQQQPSGSSSAPANVGSTGTVVVVSADAIFVANVGDSEAILIPSDGSDPEVLTTDHRPATAPREDQERILAIAAAEQRNGASRVAKTWLGASKRGLSKTGITERVSSRGHTNAYVAFPGACSLSMTRAFGNGGLKAILPAPVGRGAGRMKPPRARHVEKLSPIIVRPSVRTLRRPPRGGVIIVASDGLWDNLGPKLVQTIVAEALRGRAKPRDAGAALEEDTETETETMGDASDTELDAEPPQSTAPNPRPTPTPRTPTPTALELAELLLKKAYNDRVKDDDVTVLVSILRPTS